MRARVFIEHPEDVQVAIWLLLYYLDKVEGLSSSRRPVRAIYGKAIRNACRILKVMAHWEGDKLVTWELPKGWQERLRLAGLNPYNPLDVKHQGRWNNAWAQLVETNTFRDDRARRDIATGKKSPKAAARVKAIALAPKKAEQTFNEFMPSELKRRLKGKK